MTRYSNNWDGLKTNHTAHMTFPLPLLEAVHRTGPEVRLLKIPLDCRFETRTAVWKGILEHLPDSQVGLM